MRKQKIFLTISIFKKIKNAKSIIGKPNVNKTLLKNIIKNVAIKIILNLHTEKQYSKTSIFSYLQVAVYGFLSPNVKFQHLYFFFTLNRTRRFENSKIYNFL